MTLESVLKPSKRRLGVSFSASFKTDSRDIKTLEAKGPPAQGQQQNNRSEHCKRAATDISSVAALLYLKYDI